MLENFVKVVGIFVLAILVVFVFALILAWPVQLLWNNIMPDIFGLIEIGYWQAFQLLLLSGLIVKGSSSSSSS